MFVNSNVMVIRYTLCNIHAVTRQPGRPSGRQVGSLVGRYWYPASHPERSLPCTEFDHEYWMRFMVAEQLDTQRCKAGSMAPTFQRALHHHHRYHYQYHRYHGYDIYFHHPAIHRHPSINSQVGIQGQALPASIFHEAGNHAGGLELLIMLNPESRT